MVFFVVRIRIVVVTAGKGWRRNETLTAVCVVSRMNFTHFLLTFVEPYEKTKQNKTTSFWLL